MGFFSFYATATVNSDSSGTIGFSVEMPVGFPLLVSANVSSATIGVTVSTVGFGVSTDGAGVTRLTFTGNASALSTSINLFITFVSASSDVECTNYGLSSTSPGSYDFVGS